MKKLPVAEDGSFKSEYPKDTIGYIFDVLSFVEGHNNMTKEEQKYSLN